MTPQKIGLGLNTGTRIDEDMMTAIGWTDIIGMTGRMMTVGRLIVIIHQEMIGGHTRVTDKMMIDGEMRINMIIADIMIGGTIIDDLKELDNSNTRVGTVWNHNMLDGQRMRKESLVDQRYQIVIHVGKTVIMQINGLQKKKENHRP